MVSNYRDKKTKAELDRINQNIVNYMYNMKTTPDSIQVRTDNELLLFQDERINQYQFTTIAALIGVYVKPHVFLDAKTIMQKELFRDSSLNHCNTESKRDSLLMALRAHFRYNSNFEAIYHTEIAIKGKVPKIAIFKDSPRKTLEADNQKIATSKKK